MDEKVGGTLNAYVLVIGPDEPDRAWEVATLRAAGLEVSATTEADILVARDLVPPGMLLLDDATNLEERRASQRRLGAHPSLLGVPLLILAYEADVESYSDAISRGAAAYLVKPVAEDELVTVAHRLCDWSGAKGSEKRRRLRRPLIMRVDVELRATKVRLPGEIVNASGGGCSVEMGEEVAVGQLVRLVLHSHQGSTHVALGGEVRWHGVSPTGRHLIGVRFTGTTAVMAGPLLGFATSAMP